MWTVNCVRKCRRRVLEDCRADLWSLEGDTWSAGWQLSVSYKGVACIPAEEHKRVVRIQVVHTLQVGCTQAGGVQQVNRT